MLKNLTLTILLVTTVGCGTQMSSQHSDPRPHRPEFLRPPQKASDTEPLLRYAPYPLYPVDENYTVYGRYQ